MHMRIPFFRIWYSTTYTVLFVILTVLLAVSPGDTIYQSIRKREYQKLFVIGGVYVLTGLITLLIYSTRLYTNRTVLQAIPKPYIPVEDGEVGKLVRRMIVRALRRSAIVAWDSRPRDVRKEIQDDSGRTGGGGKHSSPAAEHPHLNLWHRSHVASTIIPVVAASPPWGHISHPGWAAPTSNDFPNLDYWSVIPELPNLIEAKAVSLAPPDPAFDESFLHVQDTTNTPLLPDAHVVAILQRPAAMGLRDYLSRLSLYGLINPPSLGPKFLAQYEYARFSTHPLTETEFRNLMAVFAEILNGMTELDPEVVDEARAGSITDTEDGDTRSLAPSQSSSNSTGSAIRYRTPRIGPLSDFSSTTTRSSDDGSHSPESLRTAPSMPQNWSPSTRRSRAPSERSLAAGSVRVRPARSLSTILPNSSSSSLGSGSSRSVVRLNLNQAGGEQPYQIYVGGNE